MHLRLLSLWFLTVVVLSPSSALAQNPFAGNWKLNTDSAKSLEHVSFITFTPAPDDGITCNIPGVPARTYTPKGTAYPNPIGFTDICKRLNDRTLDCTTMLTGRPRGRKTWILSEDRNALLLEEVHYVPGVVSKPRTVDNYVRNTPGSGFVGSWKLTVKTEGLVMHWMPAGPDGLHMETPELHTIVDLSFDSKEHHPAGPTGSYISVSATRTGPRSFAVVQKMMGTALPPTEYSVSADGRTLTAASHELNGTPKSLTYVRVQ